MVGEVSTKVRDQGPPTMDDSTSTRGTKDGQECERSEEREGREGRRPKYWYTIRFENPQFQPGSLHQGRKARSVSLPNETTWGTSAGTILLMKQGQTGR